MVASLTLAKVDLNWADEQYWCNLLKVVRVITKVYAPKEKKKLTSKEASKFIQ